MFTIKKRLTQNEGTSVYHSDIEVKVYIYIYTVLTVKKKVFLRRRDSEEWGSVLAGERKTRGALLFVSER